MDVVKSANQAAATSGDQLKTCTDNLTTTINQVTKLWSRGKIQTATRFYPAHNNLFFVRAFLFVMY